MITTLSPLARVIRHGTDTEKNTAWVSLATANGTGRARDIWTLAQAEADGIEQSAQPVQDSLW